MVTTSVRVAATLLRATSSCRAALASALRRSERLPPPGSIVSLSGDVLALRCLRRARSCAGRASRSGPGEVYEANGVLLAAAFASAGADIDVLPAVADDEASHRAALERGLAADVLVTSGGVSVGPHDLVRRILGELGVEEVFWGVAVKPGKPLAFGVRGSTLVFGLPGNPVSSLVGAEVFVRPALLALQGATDPGPVFFEGRLAAAVRRNAHRDEFLRARSARRRTAFCSIRSPVRSRT